MVFVGHLILKYVVQIYSFWPRADMPLHFLGGLSIAVFVSGAFRLLSREAADASRAQLLELVLIVSLTAAAAVFWEFGEFASDQLFGTGLQGSLMNTMWDMILGMAGALVVAGVRLWQMGVGMKDVQEFVADVAG